MPIRTQIWTVGTQPTLLRNAVLASEQFLEEMIVAAPALLSEDWLLIGRQESTGQGGRIDLLALAPDASLVLIELKRERTPREVVAQALDYAVWVERLQANDIEAIYQRFNPGGDLAADYQARFGTPLEAEALNQSHQIVIVAAELDASSERIVGYLSERDIAINVLCFQVFQLGEQQLISRAWLLDPTEAPQANVAKPGAPSEPWNGEFYCSFGDSASRNWAEARQYGFICGGGGSWYSNSLKMVGPGDRVWVNVPGAGYVGVAKVTGHATPAAEFCLFHEGREWPALELLNGAGYHRGQVNDPERCEYFVPVQWLYSVPLSEAVKEIGFFGNQNTICRPTTPKWRWTVERLKERFALDARALL